MRRNFSLKYRVKEIKAKIGRKLRKPFMLSAAVCLAVAIAWPITAIIAVIITPLIILFAMGIACYVIASQFTDSPDEGEENHG